MKSIIPKLTTLALLPAAAIVFASCSSTEPEAQPTITAHTTTAYQPGVPGGVQVQTFKETATVTGIDRATRKVTLVKKDGTQASFIAGREVANFAQIEIGDQVKATVRNELELFVPKPGESPADLAARAVVLAPLGDKPGGAVADTTQITAKVTSVDLKHHRATLQFPDGTSKIFKVRPDVELTKETVGVEVVIRTTQAVALSVEKP